MARTMRRQEGAISRQQLLAAGLSEKDVRGLVRSAALQWRLRGVYVDTRSPATPRTHLWAVQLALGDRAFFSHRTAAALLGLRAINTRKIEATVVSGHTPVRDGLIVHRCSFEPMRAERRTHNGLRHSSATRMLLEAAERETPDELVRLIGLCAQRGLLHLDQINSLIKRHPHLPGAAQAAGALAHYQPTPEDVSRFERDFADWIAAISGMPRPLRNQPVGPWEMDYVWPDQRVVVETDGDPYHRTPAQRDRDNRKDAWCQINGYGILRVSSFRFAHERSEIRSDLSAMLHRP